MVALPTRWLSSSESQTSHFSVAGLLVLLTTGTVPSYAIFFAGVATPISSYDKLATQ